jgi:uncharacterized protein (TIGR00290 family)
MLKPVAAVSWSGGKDSCLALLAGSAEFDVRHALTMLDETGERSRSHGLRPEIVAAQVAALGHRWIARRCSWPTYEAQFIDALRELATEGTTHLICGDVFGPPHKDWVEGVCREAGLVAVEPLWGRSTTELAHSFIDGGGIALICAVSAEVLGAEWLGKTLDRQTIEAFRKLGIDPGGENGEYHTVVTSCAAFSRQLAVTVGERVLRDGYWAADMLLQQPLAHVGAPSQEGPA